MKQLAAANRLILKKSLTLHDIFRIDNTEWTINS